MTLRNQRGREFFLFIFKLKLLGLVSTFVRFIYTDHFLTIVEILFTKQVFFFLVFKRFRLFSRRQCNQNGIGEASKGRKLKTNYV